MEPSCSRRMSAVVHGTAGDEIRIGVPFGVRHWVAVVRACAGRAVYLPAGGSRRGVPGPCLVPRCAPPSSLRAPVSRHGSRPGGLFFRLRGLAGWSRLGGTEPSGLGAPAPSCCGPFVRAADFWWLVFPTVRSSSVRPFRVPVASVRGRRGGARSDAGAWWPGLAVCPVPPAGAWRGAFPTGPAPVAPGRFGRRRRFRCRPAPCPWPVCFCWVRALPLLLLEVYAGSVQQHSHVAVRPDGGVSGRTPAMASAPWPPSRV